MAEASECDRCGMLTPGSPHLSLMLGDGEPRYTREELRLSDTRIQGEELFDVAHDLCQSCHNDLLAWWQHAGGDPSDIIFDDEFQGVPE